MYMDEMCNDTQQSSQPNQATHKTQLSNNNLQTPHSALLGNNPFRDGHPPLPQTVAQRVFAYLLTAELNLDMNQDEDLSVFLDLLNEPI